MTLSRSVNEAPISGNDERRASFEREALIHLDCLFRVAKRLVRNTVDAEDLLQDTVLQAYRAWDQYERGTNARAWLITITRHLFIEQYRRERCRREILSRSVPAADAHPMVSSVEDQVDDEVARAIDALPLAYRELVTLRDVEDLPYSEIATLLNLPVGTVKSRLFRARSLLKEGLRDYAISIGVIPDRGC